MKLTVKFGLLAMAVVLSACSVLEGDKIDYKSAQKGPSLEVPPDLTQLNRESRYVVPGGPVSASTYSLGQSVPNLPTAATAVGDVRIERAGNQRWLVVNRPADQLWGPVRDFWQESGFLLALDDSNLGIMETDWAENRAKLPNDVIRNTIGKVFDGAFSTGELDKFRTRVERTATGSDIFITHRGMAEVYVGQRNDSTVWQPRPGDPQLEAAFLARLMVKLGAKEEKLQPIHHPSRSLVRTAVTECTRQRFPHTILACGNRYPHTVVRVRGRRLRFSGKRESLCLEPVVLVHDTRSIATNHLASESVSNGGAIGRSARSGTRPSTRHFLVTHPT